MSSEFSNNARVRGALNGMFIGDALAMPVHWYYDTSALRRDYGKVTLYLTPKNPHPDSILWRSHYSPLNERGNILHEQSQYWGKKGIHYHQFLQAGENTLNLKLAAELLEFLFKHGDYSESLWLETMISYLLSPTSHLDTYVEEYLRHFFTQYAKGTAPADCGRNDEHHIGGYSLMLPLLISSSGHPDKAQSRSLTHLSLTHGGETMKKWGALIAAIMLDLLNGTSLVDTCERTFSATSFVPDIKEFFSLFQFPDEVVVRNHFSSACYVDLAVPATMYLALKYQDDPESALIANTMCGGDNCGRGALLGAILGAAQPQKWPQRWLDGLLNPPRIVELS